MTSMPEEATAEETALPPVREKRTPVVVSIPQRTLSILALLLVVGGVALAFAYRTVHHRLPAELSTESQAKRTNFSISYWLEHGYFASAGLLARPAQTPEGYSYYVSSTGGHLLSAFLIEKAYATIRGHESARLLAFHNECVTLFLAALLGLLTFRLASRIGAKPLHALVLAMGTVLVQFTFPDNLAAYWELSGRQPFLIFAVLYLLVQERSLDRPSTRMIVLQAVCAFLATYMEYVAGVAFLGSWIVTSAVLGLRQFSWKHVLLTAVAPALLAFAVFGAQRSLLHALHPNAPTMGSDFVFRTGLDGSAQYYGTHLDIAYRRDIARGNFPQNRELLFRWPWLFFAGTAALLIVLILGARGKVPPIVITSLLSLLGAYVLYAALFSQAFVIHPYLFDVLLFTPLALALVGVAPAVFESLTLRRGVFVSAAFFVAAWICMAQMRAYALRYPPPPASAFAAVTPK